MHLFVNPDLLLIPKGAHLSGSRHLILDENSEPEIKIALQSSESSYFESQRW